MDGLYNGDGKSEIVRQAQLTRHRLLTVNTSATGVKEPRDVSTFASLSPLDAGIPADSQEGGPHFVMSSETPDGKPTLGFEFCLSTLGMLNNAAVAGTGGFTVTIWALISNAQLSDGSAVPLWAAFTPLTGVQLNQLIHSFDVDAAILRFQIEPDTEGGGSDGSITIAFSEL